MKSMCQPSVRPGASPRGDRGGVHALLLCAVLIGATASFSPAQVFGWTKAALESPQSWTSFGHRGVGWTTSVYDASRGRTVLFDMNGAWEWDGQRLIKDRPGAGVIQDAVVAYDSNRRSIVRFGGDEQGMCSWGSGAAPSGWSQDSMDVWTGGGWSAQIPAVRPPPRARHGMVFDVSRHRLVVFGGVATVGCDMTFLDDTWEWDGMNWVQWSAPARPPAGAVAMAYDDVRARIVMVAGTETWESDGTNWVRRFPTVTPPSGGVMAYDFARARTVLVANAQTWEWSGKQWALSSVANTPSARLLSYDVRRQRLVAATDTTIWESDGTIWERRAWVGSPTDGPLAFDSMRERVVAYRPGLSVAEWDGVCWQEVPSTQSPPPRDRAALAYDAGHQRTVLFGGVTTVGSVPLNDLWQWDGVDWTQVSVAASPPAMTAPVMAYDTARARMVLFGTVAGAPGVRQTWEWTGQGWVNMNPSGEIPVGELMAMAFDESRMRTALVATTTSYNAQMGYWEWDGAGWSSPTPGSFTMPMPNASTVDHLTMAYNAASHHLVLVGGGSVADYCVAESWVQAWAPRTFPYWAYAVLPAPPYIHGRLAFDAARQHVLFVGGSSHYSAGGCHGSGTIVAENAATWLDGTMVQPSVGTVGPGCAPGTVPRLIEGIPALGNPGFMIDVAGTTPHAACVVGISLTDPAIALGSGCTLHLGELSLVLQLTANAAGFAGVALPLPADRQLLGATFFCQAAVFDPLGPLSGISLTEGHQVVLGE